MIRLLNYKQVLQRVKEAPDERGAPVRMQLEWRGDATAANPYKEEEVKTYLVDRFGLQVFIQAIQRELLHARHLNVKCIIT